MTESTVFDEELSDIAMEQVAEDGKQELGMVLPVIQWLRAVVFVLLGAILCKWIMSKF